jgi:hypothetical protein
MCQLMLLLLLLGVLGLLQLLRLLLLLFLLLCCSALALIRNDIGSCIKNKN